MKEKFNQLSRDELEQFFAKPGRDTLYSELAESMVERFVNKLLHCVIQNVNIVAKEQGASEAVKLVDSVVRQVEEISSEPPENKSVQS